MSFQAEIGPEGAAAGRILPWNRARGKSVPQSRLTLGLNFDPTVLAVNNRIGRGPI